MAEHLQQQIANLTSAQRVGVVAAVALSSFAVYATSKHNSLCGGPVDSPRHRDACPLGFFTVAPSNDINESIANIQDAVVSAGDAVQSMTDSAVADIMPAMANFDGVDPSRWKLPEMPDVPELPDMPAMALPGLPQPRRPREPLLGCPHDQVFDDHPHPQSCLQCNAGHHASNALDRAHMVWSPPTPGSSDGDGHEAAVASPSAEPLLLCPHNFCNRCKKRSYTDMVNREQMTNWTISNLNSPSSMSSFQSMMSPQALRDFANNINVNEVPVLGEAKGILGATTTDVTSSLALVAKDAEELTNKGVSEMFTSQARLGKTTLYFIFWYLCALCNDQFRIKNKSNILARFPAPHLLQAIGFVFQTYFVHEVQKHKFALLPTPADHLTWISNMNIVVPIAMAASLDVAIQLNQGDADDQFNKLCKSGSPLFILIIAYVLNFEIPTFKLTTSIASLTTGSLLTLAKALEYTYELPDVLALMTGAFFSASRWAGAQYLLQKEDKGSPIVTMGRLAPWMAICTIVFSIVFENSWLLIFQFHSFFESPIDMFEGFGQLLIFYVLWTVEVLADLLLIANTGALTFIVVKTLKSVGDLGTKIFTKGFYHDERLWIERKKTMNEETIGLHYIGLGLLLFLWHRYQIWAQNRSGGGGGSGERGRRNNTSSGGGGGGGSRRNSMNSGGGGGGGGGGSERTMSRSRGRAEGSSGGGGQCGRTGGACGKEDCEGESCGRAEGGAAECTGESCARPGAGGAGQCAAPRPCFHDIF